MTNEIIIDKCKYKFQSNEKFDGQPYCTFFNEKCKHLSYICDHNCHLFEIEQQLQRLRQELELEKRLITKIAERIFQTENSLYYSKVPMDCSSVETVEKFLRGL